MPGEATAEAIVTLPADYQTQGGVALSDEEITEDYDLSSGVEELPEATIESWLLDSTPVEEWVPLRTRRARVLLKGLTEGERQDIERAAPKKMNKQTRRPEADQNWINMELVRRSLVKPSVPNNEMLNKALAGELAYLAKEIGRISGFEVGDALEL